MSYFTRSEILMGRDVLHPLTQQQSDNLDILIEALNLIRAAYGNPLIVSSGYRPPGINSSVGGAKNSAHQDCQAVDIFDKDGSFAHFCLNNLTLLEENGIFMESPLYTMIVDSDGVRQSGWVHLQTRPASQTVFIPYAGPAKVIVGD